MRELNVIVQTSLDGFVAGINGEFDHFIGGEENLQYVCGLVDAADAILVGRKSYELLNADWPTMADKPGATQGMVRYSNWYNSVAKIVLSTTMQAGDLKNTFVINKDLASHIATLKKAAGKNILVFGSPSVVRYLLHLQLIDKIWLIVHPVIFGNGIPLFKESKEVTVLELLSSKQLSNGTLCNNYSVKKLQ